MSFARIVNSDTFGAVDFDKFAAHGVSGLGTLGVANDALYVPEKAVGIIGKAQEKINITVKDKDYRIDAMSYGELTGHDFSPFSFVNNIANEFAHIKTGLYAIYEFCYNLGLRGDELKQVVSENAQSFIEEEISRVEDFLNNKVEVEDLTDEERNTLEEYLKRLNAQTLKFKNYLHNSKVPNVIEDIKNLVYGIHNKKAA